MSARLLPYGSEKLPLVHDELVEAVIKQGKAISINGFGGWAIQFEGPNRSGVLVYIPGSVVTPDALED